MAGSTEVIETPRKSSWHHVQMTFLPPEVAKNARADYFIHTEMYALPEKQAKEQSENETLIMTLTIRYILE